MMFHDVWFSEWLVSPWSNPDKNILGLEQPMNKSQIISVLGVDSSPLCTLSNTELFIISNNEQGFTITWSVTFMKLQQE